MPSAPFGQNSQVHKAHHMQRHLEVQSLHCSDFPILEKCPRTVQPKGKNKTSKIKHDRMTSIIAPINTQNNNKNCKTKKWKQIFPHNNYSSPRTKQWTYQMIDHLLKLESTKEKSLHCNQTEKIDITRIILRYTSKM